MYESNGFHRILHLVGNLSIRALLPVSSFNIVDTGSPICSDNTRLIRIQTRPYTSSKLYNGHGWHGTAYRRRRFRGVGGSLQLSRDRTIKLKKIQPVKISRNETNYKPRLHNFLILQSLFQSTNSYIWTVRRSRRT